jgi:putative DNA primase/helicase
LRDVTAYLGIESPIKRCGKTTLLSLLLRLINRPVVGANVSSSSFFHVIQDLKPTLMIDEADRFLKSKPELQGILNAGYTPDTAYVIRMGPPVPGSKASSSVNFFSVWCPKVIAQIGHLPDTLADRSIVFRMQRKVPSGKGGKGVKGVIKGKRGQPLGPLVHRKKRCRPIFFFFF